MHRTQISLEEHQYHNLRQYAQNKNQSISAIIRELLNEHIPDIQSEAIIPSPLKQLKGIISGKGATTGREHNKLLYKNENRWHDQ